MRNYSGTAITHIICDEALYLLGLICDRDILVAVRSRESRSKILRLGQYIFGVARL